MTKIRLLSLVKCIVNAPLDWSLGNEKYEKNSDCPKKFGIKSHIQDFYFPPDKNTFKSGEFIEGDEFRFLVEPRRNKNLWLRVGLWVGSNLLLIGFIVTMIGYLSPQQEVILGRFGEYIVLDKWATVYNSRLIICRTFGLLCLICGAIVTFCAILLLHYEKAQQREYYVMRTRMKPKIVVEPPMVFKNPHDYWGMHCIPSTKSVRGVQPGFSKNLSSLSN